jgi:membrane-bound lytic murein transglycosylase
MAKRVIVGDRTSTRVAGTINKARSQVGKDLKTSTHASLKAEKDLASADIRLGNLYAQLEEVNESQLEAQTRKDAASKVIVRASAVSSQLEVAIAEFEAQVEAIIGGDAEESDA